MPKRPPAATQERSLPDHADAGPSGPGSSKRRREQVKVACTQCRNRKVKCDGERPECRRCVASQIPCHYATQSEDETRTVAIKREIEQLQKKLDDTSSILERLKSLPEKDSFELLQQLRSSRGPLESLLDAVSDSTGRGSASDHAVTQTTMPIRSAPENESAASQPEMYPSTTATAPNVGSARPETAERSRDVVADLPP